ncbi:MAG: hypothetical protein CMJ33_05805 [Phycisphaerae bacterium]|nr:hypothetical protein [Phycisphaerae bacterium]HAW96888.1 hypothetical protein [Phycisphaerales bacterium]
MSRIIPHSSLWILSAIGLLCLVCTSPATCDDVVGVLESFEPAGDDAAGVWTIGGEVYVVESGSSVVLPVSAANSERPLPVPGRLVRVQYDLRDGTRHVTRMQLFDHGPEVVQDGPHLIWKDATDATLVTVLDGSVVRTELEDLAVGDVLETPSRLVPTITVGAPAELPSASCPEARRILAVSDLEGNYETFRGFLEGNGVVDDSGDWIWGDGHLVLNGDMVDRGDRVTELLWLIRRLERQAREAGGRVHYVLGNHESMVMAGDLRYIHPNYRFSTERIGLSYDELHGVGTELGRWLRNHNSVVRVGPFLFVHAGYSPELDRLGIELDEINRTIRDGLGPPAWPASARADLRTGLIWHQQGPHWYRGYFPQHAERWGGRPDDDSIRAILRRHDVEHVVVGHTVVDEIGPIDDRPELIGIDVAWRDPSEAEGLLYDEGRIHRVDASGRRSLMDLSRPSTSSE